MIRATAHPVSRVTNPDLIGWAANTAYRQTLRTIAADPQHLGAEIGCFAVLHPWGQTLVPHPHLHCVVPGGGLSSAGTRWVACRPGCVRPVRVLSRLFRRVFLEQLDTAFETGTLHFGGTLCALEDRGAWIRYLAPVRQAEWVVDCRWCRGTDAAVRARQR